MGGQGRLLGGEVADVVVRCGCFAAVAPIRRSDTTVPSLPALRCSHIDKARVLIDIRRMAFLCGSATVFTPGQPSIEGSIITSLPAGARALSSSR